MGATPARKQGRQKRLAAPAPPSGGTRAIRYPCACGRRRADVACIMLSSPDIRLVVNADEFGASPDVSRGILRAHREGIVTSTSVLGNAPDAADLVQLLREAPDLGVGIHLTLLRGRPVAAPDTVPTLVDSHGNLADSPRPFLIRWARSHISASEIEREFDAQVIRYRDLGLSIDHLDTYLHLGFLPMVAEAMERVATRHRIASVRTRMEPPHLTWVVEFQRGLPLALLSTAGWFAKRRLGARRHGAQVWGYAESGDLGRMRLLEILGRLGPGIHELICHPGETAEECLAISGRVQRFDKPGELAALTSQVIREAVSTRNIALCRFDDLFVSRV
jgi:predicted glycoside hydrolase/deacetylase ChbG (UPF0249 family)